jgi:signal transduction histidine kinase/ligand-binding sensor domain-containing protein
LAALNSAAASERPASVGRSAWLWQSWQTDEGLPDNAVTGMAQTPDGYLWVATLGGLVRFNGVKFEEFSPLNLADVPNRVVRAMHLDHANRLWFAMDHGPVVCASASAAQTYTARDGLPDLRVSAIAESNEGIIWLACGATLCRVRDRQVIRLGARNGMPPGGNLWIATDHRGALWCLKGEQLGVVRGDRFQKVATLDNPASRFTAARDEGLWVCDGERILKLDASGALHEQARLPERTQPRAIFEDRAGALWVGTAAHGLFRCDGGHVELVSTSHPEISCITQDREGNIWAGTAGGGINRVRARVVELLGAEAGLPSESMRSVAEAADGTVWVVTQSGLLAHGDGRVWTNVTPAGAWTGRNATCVSAAPDGAVWVGTSDVGLLEMRGSQIRAWSATEGLLGDSVRSVLVTRWGEVWAATDSPPRLHQLRESAFHALNTAHAPRSIRALVEDARGTIWIGTSDGQVLRAQQGELRGDPALKEPRPLSVRYLQATADASLWIGYAGWGLGRLNNGEYARLTTTSGLNDDYVSQILPDGQERLWISSNRGIFHVRMQDLAEVAEGKGALIRSVVFGRDEGLRSLQANCDYFPSACAGRSGRLWFCLRNGLALVHSDRLVDNPHPPPVTLERVTVDDRVVALYDCGSPLCAHGAAHVLDLHEPASWLRLPAGHRKVEFDFAALSFTSPENVRFRYRLGNFDQDWIQAGAQRSAKYPRLPAGDYEFQLQACNNAGVWNQQGFSLKLGVAPFFWQTWWFRGSVLLLFTAGVAGLARYFSFRRLRRELTRLEQQAALHRERARIARDMHDEVGAKLSRLSLLSELAGQQPELPVDARREVAEISDTARDTIRSLEEIVWAVNPKNDSVADLVQYLCRFAEECFEGSPVQCSFELPESLPDVQLPTEARHHFFLAAKEALNNVAKHSGAKGVRLRVAASDHEFEIAIEDDGCGFEGSQPPARAGGGNGLSNIRDRMAAAGGQVELSSRPGAGTHVVLRLPCGEARLA